MVIVVDSIVVMVLLLLRRDRGEGLGEHEGSRLEEGCRTFDNMHVWCEWAAVQKCVAASALVSSLD
jgi:hypothetical protein